ncbi:hypothetical protein FHW96_002617 [Novosphingobium sp. SG751A]|uniref:hypothetical protein n=1 Tax=Novosphingobium sp. SG751A TaxID=2587000 RepID=UPI001553BC5F|nr:hypothetical protein [Novosphingobium sp. SG751A]NOW46457.1 hypothetical protein [Novosphingobium sp. SG751A]
MAMGTNLDGLAYWSSAMPTLDLMKSAGVWLPQAPGVYDTGEAVRLDGDGWPLAFGPSGDHRYRWLVVNVLHDNPAALPGARYAILYDGGAPLTVLDVDGARVLLRGAGRIDAMAGGKGNLYLRLDPGAAGEDRVRNIRVVREEELPLYRAGQTFSPEFVARIAPFRVLRFMDWMRTNAVFAPDGAGRPQSEEVIDHAPLLDWADRPVPTAMHWGDGGRGMPVEAMVQLANRTGAQPWFNMPINASDDYIRGFATYVRAHLRPDLKLHVELSNEVWNAIFPQSRYARAQARIAFGPDGEGQEWYGMRAAQVGIVWKQVFGQSLLHTDEPGRVAMVLGAQFDWRGPETLALETRHWRDGDGHPLRAADYVDEYAITGYYDGTMNTDAAVPTVKDWWKDADGGYGRALDALRTRIATFNTPLYRYHGAQARAYGLRLVTYESGFGESTPPSQHDNPAYTDFLTKLQRRPEITALETSNYRAFAEAGGSLFMNFGIIGASSKWGSWSALESVHQTSSPRYAALMAWLGAQPIAADAIRAGSQKSAAPRPDSVATAAAGR